MAKIFTAGFNPVTRSTVWKCEDCRSHWEGRSSEHKCQFPGPILQSLPTLQSLLESHGSFRRLIDAYWTSQLSPTEERIIEDATPKEAIASFKPVRQMYVGIEQPFSDSAKSGCETGPYPDTHRSTQWQETNRNPWQVGETAKHSGTPQWER